MGIHKIISSKLGQLKGPKIARFLQLTSAEDIQDPRLVVLLSRDVETDIYSYNNRG